MAKGNSWEIDVDDSDLKKYLRDGEDVIGRLVGDLADELRDQLRDESASASKRVSAAWEVEVGATEATVQLPRGASPDVFFAPFLAKGTKDHGPRKASQMIFQLDGEVIRTGHVRGVRANPFHERAMATTERKAPDIIARLIGQLT